MKNDAIPSAISVGAVEGVLVTLLESQRYAEVEYQTQIQRLQGELDDSLREAVVRHARELLGRKKMIQEAIDLIRSRCNVHA